MDATNEMNKTAQPAVKPKNKFISLITNIAFWVLIAIIAGAVLGNYDKETAIKMEVLSKLFIQIIKWFTDPIIFLTIVTGIANAGNLKKVGVIGAKALLYFEIASTVALVIGVALAYLLQPGHISMAGLIAGQKPAPKAPEPWYIHYLTLLILALGIVVGSVLNQLSDTVRKSVVDKLNFVAKYVFMLLKWVMYLAPIAAFGGIAFAVGKFGLGSLLPLGKLVASVYTAMLIFVFVILGMVMKYYCKISLWHYIRRIKEELLIVWSTSSSESALPNLMVKLEQMGCPRSVVGLVVPTGYSFNLDGTAIYLSMSVIFLAQLYNVNLSFSEIVALLGILMITSKGAAGVTGSGFIVLSSTLLAMGNKIPVEGLMFLLGVDKFMSEARALTNFTGNGIASLVISKSQKELDTDKFHQMEHDMETHKP